MLNWSKEGSSVEPRIMTQPISEKKLNHSEVELLIDPVDNKEVEGGSVMESEVLGNTGDNGTENPLDGHFDEISGSIYNRIGIVYDDTTKKLYVNDKYVLELKSCKGFLKVKTISEISGAVLFNDEINGYDEIVYSMINGLNDHLPDVISEWYSSSKTVITSIEDLTRLAYDGGKEFVGNFVTLNLECSKGNGEEIRELQFNYSDDTVLTLTVNINDYEILEMYLGNAREEFKVKLSNQSDIVNIIYRTLDIQRFLCSLDYSNKFERENFNEIKLDLYSMLYVSMDKINGITKEVREKL